ncbi:MAG: hypothetical protein ACJ77K_02245 [Bacteroidia bacterium]|jgi:hypothetical protein
MRTPFNMEGNTNFIEPSVERAEAYGKTSLELLKLAALDKTAGMSSVFVSRSIAILLFSMFTVIFNIGISFWLGDLLGKLHYGFFCVAAFYAIAGIIVWFVMHDRISKYFSNAIISQVLR